MIIDWEHHYLPEELWLKKGGKRDEIKFFYENGKPRGTLYPELYDIDEHIRVMDAVGIDVAVLSMAISNDNTKIALEECRIWNDKVYDILKKYPGRFVALTPVPPLGGDDTSSELDRAIKQLDFKGVVIRSQASGLSMDAKELWPFYKKVSDLKVPIFIHPSGVQRGFDILNAPYDLNRSIGRELDLIVATTRMILSGVLDEFPDLVFVIAHKGGGIAALKERIDYHFPRVGVTGTSNKVPFTDCLDRLYFDLAGHVGGMNSIKCALTCMKPGQLLFGTDYPQEFADNPMKIKTYIDNIENLALDSNEKKMMLGDNAKNLLRL